GSGGPAQGGERTPPAPGEGGLALRAAEGAAQARPASLTSATFSRCRSVRPPHAAPPEAPPMRRWLPLLTVVLLSAVALFAGRLCSPRQPPPADDDLSDLLDDLPHVASVEGEAKGRSERVVVHLRDWHLVPRDAFDKDVKAAAGRDLNRAELDRLYAEHLDA